MTRGEVRKYLDDTIRGWREAKEETTNKHDQHTAACYVDAFQSVRKTIFGETL